MLAITQASKWHNLVLNQQMLSEILEKFAV